uniref:Cobyrinate a,c-diamide synthase n=1 Tax=uncultured bacterium ws034A6 TaxID=1131824 RepID=I1X563_9BACT|nr:cobyrinic acid a,c-diamide synthase DsrN [uncultured bacterium ws034A6]
MSRLLISAAHKSSGKTTVTLGLCAALAERGLVVQPFKKGPDYIDPMWLGQAAGRPCHNLDFYNMSHEEILTTTGHYSADADIALIEGNKGLYDGLDLDGSNSNAALAKLLQSPVVLVLDARGMTRGIAPLILGNQAFDPEIRIAGVILNQLGGSRHEAKLRAVIEHYTDVPVIGGVHRDKSLEITERHLGLIPSNEDASAQNKIHHIRDLIKAQVDLDQLLSITGKSPLAFEPLPVPAEAPGRRMRIGIARDAAFGFYYPDDLDALERAGAELVTFNTLQDKTLPDIDGLFIGGGFPESRMRELEANCELRASIRNAIDHGMPAYAECGGLMYLARSLSWKDRQCEMVGVIPGDIIMHERPQGRGYVRLQETGNAPWPGAPQQAEFAAHEFHYSSLENVSSPLKFAYMVKRGTGIDGKNDGVVINRLLACYSHMRDTEQHRWARRFVEFVRNSRA